MSLHRAKLIAHSLVLDGVEVSLVKDDVTLGKEYIVDTARKLRNNAFYSTIHQRSFKTDWIWIGSQDGWFALNVLEVDEGVVA